MRYSLKAIDKIIINRLQQGIPFISKPWEALAKEIKLNEGQLLRKIAFLKKNGFIRRISANFSPAMIGFASTLIAAHVANDDIKSAVEKINSYPEVTHNYARNAKYNLWFTLVAKDQDRIEQIKAELKRNKEFKKILDLPAQKMFKVDVNLKV